MKQDEFTPEINLRKKDNSSYQLLSEYRCAACSFSWKEQPGPTQCRNCSSLLVKWMNYHKFM